MNDRILDEWEVDCEKVFKVEFLMGTLERVALENRQRSNRDVQGKIRVATLFAKDLVRLIEIDAEMWGATNTLLRAEVQTWWRTALSCAGAKNGSPLSPGETQYWENWLEKNSIGFARETAVAG